MSNIEVKIPTVKEIKSCSDIDKLKEWKASLMDNVQMLITENHLEWTLWETLMDHLAYKIDGVPMSVYLPPRPGEVKGIRV